MAQVRTALLIMDVQPEIVAQFGDPGVTDRLARAAAAARAAGVLVVYVTVRHVQRHVHEPDRGEHRRGWMEGP